MLKKDLENLLPIVIIVSALLIIGVIVFALIYVDAKQSSFYQKGYNNGYNQSIEELSLMQQARASAETNAQSFNQSLSRCSTDLNNCLARPTQVVNYTSDGYPLFYGTFNLNHNEIYLILTTYSISLIFLIPLSFSVFKFEIKLDWKIFLWIIFIVLLVLPLFFLFIS